MKGLAPYLNFQGNTREAMQFYADTLGGELTVQSFKDSGMPTEPGNEDGVIHARLSNGPLTLMASDAQPGAPFSQGNAYYLCVDCESVSEIERLYNAFSAGGKVLMELQDTFWGAKFGIITDKFGVNWMFNCETGKQA
jgi:PhnB protein